jgi:transposase-like protein
MQDHTIHSTNLDAIRIDSKEVTNFLNSKVRQTVQETINGLLDAEADDLCNASKYERNADRTNGRAGHYTRSLLTTSGPVEVNMPKLRGAKFETQIIERYRTKQASVEESLIDMYLAGVSVRRIEDITQALWGERVSSSTISELNKKIYGRIEEWRNAPIQGEYPYLFLDGIWLKRSWGGEVTNVSVLIAVGINQDGYREILGVAEGAREDKESWRHFLRYLKDRGLKGVRMVTSDCCMGLVETLAEFYPEAKWQRCMVHWYRNLNSKLPLKHVKQVMAMAKALHAQESKAAAERKKDEVTRTLREMRLEAAARFIEESFDEVMTYHNFPAEHRKKIRSNNMLERVNREVRRRTRAVGSFPDGQSALMLVAARLRYIAGKDWGTKRYMNMDHLRETTTALTMNESEVS